MPSRWVKYLSLICWANFLVSQAWAEFDIDAPNASTDEETAKYYAGSSDGSVDDSNGGNIDPKYHAYNLSVGQDEDPDREDILLFDVESHDSLTAGTGQVRVLTAQINVSGAKSLVPIAAFGTTSQSAPDLTACSASTSCRFNSLVIDSTTNEDFDDKFRFGVDYTGSKMRIGIYPKDICQVIATMGDTNVDACGTSDAGDVNSPNETDDNTTQFSIIFSVRVVNSGSAIDATSSENVESSSAVTLNFYYYPPSDAKCSEGQMYFPSDQAIIVNSNNISADTENGGASINKILVIAKKNASVSTDEDFRSNNDLVEEIPYLQGEQTVTGFENSSTDSYEVAFTVRDKAGLIAAIPATNDSKFCNVSGVQTSAIYGFLKKGNCFVATAAYNEISNPWMKLLREFRDEILMRSGIGRAFVNFYYSHSGPAAAFVLEHPVLRPLALLLLLPIEIIIWICMNAFLVPLVLGAGFAVYRFAHRGVY